MIFDFLQFDESKHNSDFTIIGSGACGLFLAVLLAKSNRTVTLFEAGDDVLDGFSVDSYQSIGWPHQGIGISRSRTLGGTTNLWGGQLVELTPYDLKQKSLHQNSNAWPIGFEELKDLYRNVYEELGFPEEIQHDDYIWKKLNIKPPNDNGDFQVFLSRWLKIPNLRVYYQNFIQTNQNLILVKNATFVDADFDNGEVQTIYLKNKSLCEKKTSVKKLIFAMGTIENTRLLLKLKGKKNCGFKSNDNIGAFFNDHIGCRAAEIKITNKKGFLDLFSTKVYNNFKFQPKIRAKDNWLASFDTISIQCMISFESSFNENLVFLKQFIKALIYQRKFGSLMDLLRNTLAIYKFVLPLIWNYLVRNRIFVPVGNKVGLQVQMENRVNVASRININEKVLDRFGLPKVILDWRVVEDDFYDLRRFLESLSTWFEATQVGTLKIDYRYLDDLNFAKQNSFDTGHQAGGCVYGNSQTSGVVDKNLSVYGCPNLFIVGACVLPSSGNANITFTAMAFAFKLFKYLTSNG